MGFPGSFATVVLFAMVQIVSGIKILLPGSWTECIHQEVQAPAKRVTGGIAVTPVREGFDATVKVEITNPEGQTVWALPITHEVEFSFAAKTYGKYKLCFQAVRESAYIQLMYLETEDDEDSSGGDKAVRKPHGSEDDRSQDLASDAEVKEIRYKMMSLGSVMNILVGEQRMMKHKYEWQVQHAKHTHARTLWFTVLEGAVLLVVSLAQVYCIRQFFNDSTVARRPVVKGLFNAAGPAPTSRSFTGASGPSPVSRSFNAPAPRNFRY